MAANTTTELAKWRTWAAAERTLLAWVRSTLMLLGFGIVLGYLSGIPAQKLPNMSLVLTSESLRTLGLLSIALALVLLGLAIWQHRIIISSLCRADYVLLSGWPMEKASTMAVLTYSLVALVILLFKP